MLIKRCRELSLGKCCCRSGMLIGICLQFSIRRHARRIGAFRKCERIGRGFAKRLAGSGSPKFERRRSQRAANLQPKVKKKGQNRKQLTATTSFCSAPIPVVGSQPATGQFAYNDRSSDVTFSARMLAKESTSAGQLVVPVPQSGDRIARDFR